MTWIKTLSYDIKGLDPDNYTTLTIQILFLWNICVPDHLIPEQNNRYHQNVQCGLGMQRKWAILRELTHKEKPKLILFPVQDRWKWDERHVSDPSLIQTSLDAERQHLNTEIQWNTQTFVPVTFKQHRLVFNNCFQLLKRRHVRLQVFLNIFLKWHNAKILRSIKMTTYKNRNIRGE